MSTTEHKRLKPVCIGLEYYVHECFNSNRHLCGTIYKLTREDYVNWEHYWPYDCFDETTHKRYQPNKPDLYICEHHLYLDAGDCDCPAEVDTHTYDWSQRV